MYLYNDKKQLHQWDLNQKVIVVNELIKEVHFTNASLGKALVVEVVDRTANIPNILLQEAWDIKAYGYCGECVRESLVINVIPRAKPEDYVYTETEIKRYETLEAEIVELKDAVAANSADIEALKQGVVVDDINPVFAENSWETIAEVARKGVAQNYWKVGDYKMLTLGETVKLNPTNTLEVGWVDWDIVYQGIYGNDYGTVLYFRDWEKFSSLLGGKAGRYIIECPNSYFGNPFVIYRVEEENNVEIYRGTRESMGVDITDITESPDRWELEVEAETIEMQYPLQIIGFNHDKVIEPYQYGKQKAGLTLQLGCSRSQFGDTQPSLYDGSINGIMTEKGYFLSPNRVNADLTIGKGTNWADGGFRLALQNMFDNTEIAPYLVTVQKYTSQFYNNNNHWEAPMITEDKVFLLSEFEMFGRKLQAPAIEGDYYEFYKDGNSKFMWHKDMLNGKSNLGLLWLRSAQAEQVNGKLDDSNSTCCCYLDDNRKTTNTLNYAPSAAGNATEARLGFISPCICI